MTDAAGSSRKLAEKGFGVTDMQAPQLTVIEPLAGSVHGEECALIVTALDDAAGVAAVEYSVDGGEWIGLELFDSATGTYSGIWRPAVEGWHSLRFRAADKAGNVCEYVSVDLSVDLRTPFEKLTGTLAVDSGVLYIGQEASFLYSLTNDSATVLDGITVRIVLSESGSGAVAADVSETVSLPQSGIYSANLNRSTADLAAGEYRALLQVQQESAVRDLAEVAFELGPSIEEVETPPDLINVLVWVNDWCPPRDCPCAECHQDLCVSEELVESALRDRVDNYRIVSRQLEFEKELRNPLYTDIVILGNFEPLGCVASAELRERVNAGSGLVSSLWIKYVHAAGGFCWDLATLFGVEWLCLPMFCDIQVQTVESPVTPAAVFAADGMAVRIGAGANAEVVGTISHGDEEYPGIVTGSYGQGRSVFFAFDLGLTLDAATLDLLGEMLGRSISYVHQERNHETVLPYGAVPLKYAVTSLGGAVMLKAAVSYPETADLYDPGQQSWVNDNPWLVELPLAAGATRDITCYVVAPDMAGEHNLQTEVDFELEGEDIHYGEYARVFNVTMDMATMTAQLLAALDDLDTSFWEIWKVLAARTCIERLAAREVATAFDIEMNIHDVLGALESVLAIRSADTAEVRVRLDQLLAALEGKAYLFVPPLEILDVRVELSDSGVSCGDAVDLNCTVTNQGKQVLYGVRLDLELVNTITGRRELLASEECNLERGLPYEMAFTLDTGGFDPGRYRVELVATDPADTAIIACADLDIAAVPHAPVAEAGGPYLARTGEAVMLDASASSDPDTGTSEFGLPPFDGIILYEWENDPDGASEFDDASGMITWLPGFADPGRYEILLRVTDNTALAFAGSGGQNLTADDAAEVMISSPGFDSFHAYPFWQDVCLGWDSFGAGEYEVLRSDQGPNRGYSVIGVTSAESYRDCGISRRTDYWYRVRCGSGGETRLSASGHVYLW